ncbi:MAG: hypothetical protein WC330_03995 [Candidatus Omnitrophota bacterium]
MLYLTMRILCRKIILCAAAMLLLNAFILAGVYSAGEQYCSCCNGSKCHDSTKCHNAQDVCACRHTQVAQVVLPENNDLDYPVLSSYSVLSSRFTYCYLSGDDIFHPPRA